MPQYGQWENCRLHNQNKGEVPSVRDAQFKRCLLVFAEHKKSYMRTLPTGVGNSSGGDLIEYIA